MMMSAQLQQASGASASQGNDATPVVATCPCPPQGSQPADPTALQSMRNRAGDSDSPYIQLQKHTPVAWQLLDDEAIALAKRQNKLIFMNIGFKACHYCRLTTQDSFSNPSVASLLNSAFIPIIVDREERPDIDIIYMNYIQAVNSVGGWPLNLFLTPELEPVFGGTYWPGPGSDNGGEPSPSGIGGKHAEGRGGHGHEMAEDDRLDFLNILKKLERVWIEQEAKCRREAKEIVLQLREFAAEGTLGTRHSNSVVTAAPTATSTATTTTTFKIAAITPSKSRATEVPSQRSEPGQTASIVLTSAPAPAATVDSTTHSIAAPTIPATPLCAAGDLDVDLDQLEEAYTHIAKTFDPVHGGFNAAPKFPTPSKLSFLLRLARFPLAVADVVGHNEVRHAAQMALHTLRAIRDGGMRDHVGAGFSRYSTTDDWSVPHFEKMTSDNALLLGLYLDAWLTTSPGSDTGGDRPLTSMTARGDSGGAVNDECVASDASSHKPSPQLKLEDEFADVVLELAEYLTSPPICTEYGLFVTSEASDSFHGKGDKHMREGGYYLWTRREFDSAITTPLPLAPITSANNSGSGGNVTTAEPINSGGGDDDHTRQLHARVAAAHWNVLEDGNIPMEQDPHDEFVNQNVLRVVKDLGELSTVFGVPVDEVKKIVVSAKQKLRSRRERERVRPEVDDKVVLSYNGMAISALARTGAALRWGGVEAQKGQAYVTAAETAAAVIKEKMWDQGMGVLYRTFRKGVRGRTPALAEDYAFLIEGLLDLYEATGKDGYLRWADELQGKQIDLFYDHILPNSTAAEHTATTSPTPTLSTVVATTPNRSSSGGFYSTTESAPHTILRLKDGMDTAQPSTNAVSASNLFRLALILSKDETYGILARETIKAFEVETLQYPWLFPSLLSAVVTARLGSDVSIAAGEDEAACRVRREFCTAPRAATRVLISVKDGFPDSSLVEFIPRLRGLMIPGDQKT